MRSGKVRLISPKEDGNIRGTEEEVVVGKEESENVRREGRLRGPIWEGEGPGVDNECKTSGGSDERVEV